jgi:hypothetical protein
MATTTVYFNPSNSANFQFNVTLDSVNYTAICTWNLYSQRYYLNIYNSFGSLQLSIPIIPSPDTYSISLTKGYFQTSIVYRLSSQNFEITS